MHISQKKNTCHLKGRYMELFKNTADMPFSAEAKEFHFTGFRCVASLWRNVFAGKTCTLLLRASTICSDSALRGVKIILASLICLIFFFLSFFLPLFQSRYAKYFFADGAWPVASCRACSLLCATLCVSDKAGPIPY